MVVLKFGGSSVGQPERFGKAIAIVQGYSDSGMKSAVIASALSGVTDQLVDAGSQCGDVDYDETDFLHWMHERHVDHAQSVLNEEAVSRFKSTLSHFLVRIHKVIKLIRGGQDVRTIAAARDELLAVGERLSVHIFARALMQEGYQAITVDATRFIETDDSFGAAQVNTAATLRKIHQWQSTLPAETIPVITGFIGSAPDGRTTTLGRGGSDYSASLLAAGLKANKLERWTDVDGIYTGDPRKDPEAKRLDYIIMEDALSWNKAGKMGLHRKTLDPLIEARIPLFVRCTDTPEKPGTEVQPRRFKQAIAC